MGTVETGSRHWPMHGRPLSPSPVREPHDVRHQELPPRNGGRRKSENLSPKESLPSIAFLDLHRTAHDTRHREQNPPAMATTTGTGSTSTSLVSPTSSSYPHHHLPSDSHSSYKPPDPNSACPSPRRLDEREQNQQQPSLSSQPRQSLPSIHEALGNDNLYPPPTSQHQQPATPATAVSQQNIVPHPAGDAPSGPPNPFSNAPPPTSAPATTAQTYSYQPPQSSGVPSQQQQDNQQQPQRLSLISTTSQESGGRSVPSLGSSNRSPTQSSKTGQSSISSGGRSSEPPGPAYTKAMASPTSYGPYGQHLMYQGQQQQQQQHRNHNHHQHHHHQQQQQQQHHHQHMPTGQAPVAYSSAPAPAHFDARPQGAPGPWSGDSAEYGQAEDPQRAAAAATTPRGSAPLVPYSESVKRHLEGYDVEASLNEIAEASSRSLDFSRVYAARTHQNNRAGPLVGSLPALSEIDALLQLNHRSSDALARIRNTVLSHEHAMAEQRTSQQQGPYHNDHGPMYQEDTTGSGGFASGDPKKRRGGKAAPPGRCHSCNRAETPEWRRGPDGARTLCNACGLHYAKLTRKMGANKASALGSNFRPRSSVEMRS